MTRIYCIREEGGKPVAAKLMKRAYVNHWSIISMQTKLVTSGKWTRTVPLCADIPLRLQAARWAASLIGVNPRYVLAPDALVHYVRGPNWNDPEVGCAHYEERVKSIGQELWHEFSSYRGCTVDEAERRFRLLMSDIGMISRKEAQHGE